MPHFDKELHEFADYFAKNYKTLDVLNKDRSKGVYYSKKENYCIEYIDDLRTDDVPETGGTPVRIALYPDNLYVLQVSKQTITTRDISPVYDTEDFVYGLVLWGAAANEVFNKTGKLDDIQIDQITFEEFAETGKSVQHFAAGWFILFQYNPNENNSRRAQALNVRVSNALQKNTEEKNTEQK